MAIKNNPKYIKLSASCGPEEAEQLHDLLLTEAKPIDASELEHLHAAVLQVLLMHKSYLGKPPQAEPWKTHLSKQLSTEAP